MGIVLLNLDLLYVKLLSCKANKKNLTLRSVGYMFKTFIFVFFDSKKIWKKKPAIHGKAPSVT